MTYVYEPNGEKKPDKKDEKKTEEKPAEKPEENPVDIAQPVADDAWQKAAEASAEAQKPDDPKPRLFVEVLDVELTPEARLVAAVASADIRNAIDTFDEDTKSIAAERKAMRAEMVAKARAQGDMARTGRTQAEVQCAEIISFATNSKWKVRLDRKNEDGTCERIGREQPLSDSDRQAALPLEDEGSTTPDDDSPSVLASAEGPKLKLVKGRKKRK